MNTLRKILYLLILTLPIVLLDAQGSRVSLSIKPQEFVKVPRIAPYRAQVKGTGLEGAVNPDQYIVGPGDIFVISIIGSNPYLIEAAVTPAGQLIIPEIGSLDANGKTASTVIDGIKNVITRQFPEYRVESYLHGIREIRVSASGAVKAPGFYYVTPLLRIADLISRAGGWSANAALHRIVISNAGQEQRQIDLTQFLRHGELNHNPLLKAGDEILVPYADISSELISVRGIGRKPEYFAFSPAETLGEFIDRWFPQKGRSDIGLVEIRRVRADGAEEIVVKHTADYYGTTLQANDIIYLKPLPAVHVVGEVRRPGRYEYQPGLTAISYIAEAAGLSPDGSYTNVKITGSGGKKRGGLEIVIAAGDVIQVGRSSRSALVGQSGYIQVGLAVLNMYLAYLAATR
jgi:protein involved in polysaccharide export with SLBB domain